MARTEADASPPGHPEATAAWTPRTFGFNAEPLPPPGFEPVDRRGRA